MSLTLPVWARLLREQASPRMPALFLGHGNPMNAIQDNPFTRRLQEVGRELPRPQAALVVSAHWETRGTWVQASAQPRTIHDFGGFPPALFAVQYPAPGSPEWAQKTIDVGQAHQVLVHPTEEWGLDHGTWSVLRFLYPDADVPLFQLSLDIARSPQQHHELARLLRTLREQGVMIIGSGNLVHNLREVDWHHQYGGPVFDWAQDFDQRLVQLIAQQNIAQLATTTPDALFRRAQPTLEHYLPLLYVLGASYPDEQPQYFYEDFQHGSISMRSFLMAKA
ncbi:MAG: 4,5-DOPA dioxygenase extradiol [Bacteroidetes bacterium]|nr:4,5-DOPA dioxygenase extradiol [Bacteroidota bacterium]